MDDVDRDRRASRRGTGRRAERRGRRPASRRAPGLLPSTPRTWTPMRRSASTWTVPMKPVPITPAPIWATLVIALRTHGCRPVLCAFSRARLLQPALAMILCPVKCKSRPVRRQRAAYHAIVSERPTGGSPGPSISRQARSPGRPCGPRPGAGRGAGCLRHGPRRDPPRPFGLAPGARQPDRPGTGDRRPAGRRAHRSRPGRRGRRRPQHGRPAAAPADLPGECRAPPHRRPRGHQHRRGAHQPGRPDPRPSRRTGPHRGRPRALPGPRGRAVRPAAADDARHPRPPVGRRHRGARPGRVPDRPADLAADHARLGRLSDPRAVRRPLPRAGLGRQRRQRPCPRRVALRRRGRPRRRRRGQDRDRHRGRDHLGRAAPSRRPGQRRRRRPHPGRRRPVRHLPLRQHRLPRGARRAAPRWPGPERPRRGRVAARVSSRPSTSTER